MASSVFQGNPSNFPGGFPAGVSVRGMPLVFPQAQGQVFYVDNSTNTLPSGAVAGSDGNRGTYNRPFSTLQHAVNACIAGNGDIIFVSPLHAETISSATALALSVAGVTIIGVGTGTARPTFTLDTANTSTITVSAANVTLVNCVFIANFLNIAALFTLTTAKGFTLDGCEVRDTSGILNFLNVVTTSATSNANDGLSITRNKIMLQATSGVVNLLSALGTHDRVEVSDNYFSSLTTNAGAVIPIAAGKVLTNFLLLRNRFNIVNAAATTTGYIITTNGSTNSGFIDGNVDHALPNTTFANSLFCTASSGFVFGLNYHSRTADKSGTVLPAADS